MSSHRRTDGPAAGGGLVDSRLVSYWYASSPEDERSTSVMEALRSYRAAEVAMRRRTQQSMDMGENELLVLRYLTRARARGQDVTPAELSRYLGITSASTTALLDRLEKSGHISRGRHPSDRRSIIISVTARSDAEIRQTLGGMHERMMAVVRRMKERDRDVVIAFLDEMRAAVDEVDA
jgi:DNA-binding MarR family transcriptional regulator